MRPGDRRFVRNWTVIGAVVGGILGGMAGGVLHLSQAFGAVRNTYVNPKVLDEYSGQWHKCRKAARCSPGKNIRREGLSKNLRPVEANYSRAIRRLRHQYDNPPGWVIPPYIVMCESHGLNLPPNSASASGYYQILQSTWWRQGGGRYASAAYLATKREQDRIAVRIMATGGPSQWVCS